MNKSLIFLISFVFFSSLAPQSIAMISAPSFPTGVYLGVGGGYNATKANVKDSAVHELNVGANPFTITGAANNVSAFSLTGLCGYLHQFKTSPFTMGLELFLSFHNGDKLYENTRRDPGGNNERIILKTRIRDQYEYGAKAIMGLIFKDVYHGYALVGFSRQDFKIDANMVNTDAAQFHSRTLSQKLKKTNIIVGLGIERTLQNFKFGLEWFYRIQNKSTIINNRLVDGVVGANPITASTPVTIKGSHCILFKMAYNFTSF